MSSKGRIVKIRSVTLPAKAPTAMMFLVALALLVAIANWVGPQAAHAQSSAAFTVDSSADDFDRNPGDGLCATSANACTLRAAIQEANKHAGPDTIAFNIPGGGVQTIQLNSTLPNLSDATGPTTIDGYTQPGSSPNTDPLVSNAAIMVQIAGAGSAGFDALRISSSGNLVRGLAFYNLRRSIQLIGSGANDNVVVGNFIGTDATGTSSAPASAASASGVDIREGASTNRIGGTSPAERNVISGSALNGIGIYHQTTHANVIQNNLIGLSPGGDARLPNRRQGIDINNDSYANVVGGDGPGERNVFSGNSGAGVEVSHGRANSENQVIGNFIGTDVTGKSAPAYARNVEFGIHLEDGVTNNTFAENVVGNNDKGGVRIEGFFTNDNHFRDNRIGVSLDGTPIPNRNAGIQIEFHATGSKIGPNNIIAHNTTGVSVAEDDVDFHTITRNSIFANTGLGIDLQPLGGRNANDSGDADSGTNEQLNFPTLTSATPEKVSGTACAESVVPKPCTVEVFLSDGVANEYGEGKTFVGSSTTNPDGTFTVAVSGVSDGAYVTATATDATGNTSEFSLNRVVKKTPPAVPPAAPSGLTATAVSSSKIDLQWTDNATDETAYTVERSLDGTTGWTELTSTLAAGTTGYSDTNLQPGTTYYYRVKATNSAGSSDYSNDATATTNVSSQPPPDPSGLGATAVSSSRIDLQWTDNATNETAYTVERSLDGSTNWTELTSTLPADTTTYSDTGLSAGTTYYYRVKATNSAGSSNYTDTANATTSADTNVFSESWTGADGAAWDGSRWTTNVGASATADILSNQGRMRFENVSNARALAIASMPKRADTEVLMSFTTPSIEAKGFLQIFSRASGNWVGGYPNSGYFVEIQNNNTSVGLRKVSAGTITQVSNAAIGRATTTKQWVRFRVEGSTLKVKVWTDGAPEPSAWEMQATDSSFSDAGVLQLRWQRASTATGAREVFLDDLTVTDLSP
jgi:CSLREA domain-containing protein